MSLRQRIVALAFATTLGGCATQAQMAAYQIQQNVVAGVKISEDCMAKFRTLPVYGRLNQDFIVEDNDPDSARKLAITRRISSEQATDILEAVQIMETCEAPAWQLVAAAVPSLAPVIKQMNREWEQGIQQAVANRAPIGEANKSVKDHRERASALGSQVGQELSNQLVRAHNSEIAQQQQAAAVAATAAALLIAYKQVPISNQVFAGTAIASGQPAYQQESRTQQLMRDIEARDLRDELDNQQRRQQQQQQEQQREINNLNQKIEAIRLGLPY